MYTGQRFFLVQQLSLTSQCGCHQNNNALKELNNCIGGLLHLGLNVITSRTLLHIGANVITFRTLLHLGPNVVTFRNLLHLGQLLHLGLQHLLP